MEIEQGMSSNRAFRGGRISISPAKAAPSLLDEGRKRHALDGANGALRIRIKFSQGFDGISEQFEAHGTFSFCGKNVDDSTTDGELAGHFHHVVGFVADAPEMRHQVVERN